MKYLSVVCCCLFSLIIFAQNSKKTPYSNYKKKDDIEGYIYATIDAFLRNSSTENLVLFTNLEQKLWRKPSSKAEKIAWLHGLIQQGYQYKKFGKIPAALHVYEKALHYYRTQHLTRYNIVEYCLLPMATNYTRLGAFDRAEIVLKVAETKASKQADPIKLAAVYNNLSIVYQSQGLYPKAIKLLEKTLKLKGLPQTQKARVLGNIAIIMMRLNKLEIALKYAEKSRILHPKNIELTQKLASIKALYYENKKEFITAGSEYKKAMLLAEKQFGTGSREHIKSSLNLADFYRNQQQLEKALFIYSNCLKNQNNSLETIDNSLKKIYEGMGDIAYEKGEISSAIDSYKQGLKANQNLKESFVSAISKIRLLVESNALSEKIIAAYYELYTVSNNQKYALSALNISEHSKANILLEQLQQASINQWDSRDTYSKETALKLRINEQKHQRMLEEQNHELANITKLKHINKQLDILNNELQLLKQTKGRIPLSKPSEIKKEELLSILQNNQQLLIEYFVGSEAVYVFSISKNTALTFRKINNKDQFQKQLRKFYELFAVAAGEKINTNIQEYNTQAYQLYVQLLQPELEGNTYTSLIIIPDAAIGLIPFDALHNAPTSSSDFSKMPYVLHQSEIIYNVSIQLMRMHKKQPLNQSFTGFFPVFDVENSTHQPLKNTLTEATNIHKTMGGTLFLRKNASKENFLKQQKTTGILHLATHASSGTGQIPPSIEFADKTLYLTELYGMQFMSQLIVLSACETNVGPIYKGEGILSLARGFIYAGIQNSIVSQWKVNDKATEFLMSEFYKNLKKSIPISTALQQSKEAYISSSKIHPSKKSPYYWAGFSYMGHSENTSKKPIILWSIPITLAIVLMGFYYTKKRRVSNQKNHLETQGDS